MQYSNAFSWKQVGSIFRTFFISVFYVISLVMHIGHFVETTKQLSSQLTNKNKEVKMKNNQSQKLSIADYENSNISPVTHSI